jgi:hypothetical protein
MRNGQRKLGKAYSLLHHSLASILYAKDPGEMGSSAGTPLDKYDSEAASLIVKLKKAATREDVQPF